MIKMELAANEKENEHTPRISAWKRIPPQDSGWLTTRKTKLRKCALQFACVTKYCIPGPVITTIIIDHIWIFTGIIIMHTTSLYTNNVHYLKTTTNFRVFAGVHQ